MHYGVDPAAVGADGDGMAAAVRAMMPVRFETDVEPVGQAFGGRLTRAALGELGRVWDERVLRARLGVGQLGTALGQAGTRYVEVEQIAARALGSVAPKP